MDRAPLPLPGTVVVARVPEGDMYPAEAVGGHDLDISLAAPGTGRAGGVWVGGTGTGTEPPPPGAVVELRWDNVHETCTAGGVVVSNSATGTERWRVSLTSGPETLRRRHPRVRTSLPVQVLRGDAAPVGALALDLSEGGMRLRVVGEVPRLRRADPVALAFTLGDTRVRCSGVVVHTAQERGDAAGAEFGVVFAALPPAVRDLIGGIARGVAQPGVTQ